MMHKTASGYEAEKSSPDFGHPIPAAESPRPAQDDGLAGSALATDPRIVVLRGTLLALVHRDGRDLTARQLTGCLTVYLDQHTHTVGSLADVLNTSRPAITRIMDRLVRHGLVAREEDPEDRRRVFARRTTRGASFMRELVGICHAVDDRVARDAAQH
jgi:DNA-binding MarR family transcriptional regulator